MRTLDFATHFIRFDESSDITGPFRIETYPFLRAPMEAADDIRCRRLVIFKASSCMGSVLGEIINTKRVMCDVGNQIMVCQTDEKADQWSKTRGKKWLRSIRGIERLISIDKYAVTNSLWMFRHKWLLISGPGINNAQSDQCRFLQSDESHLEAFGPGCLVEWEKRMGGKWNRQATHITTAPDSGKEVDTFYEAGNQNEWHWRCPSCSLLVWPLWEDDSREYYNGHRVLAPLYGAMHFDCPHCGKSRADTSRNRYELVRDGDYVAKNPLASPETQSFRWSAWAAAHWMTWQSHQIEYDTAMAAARLGDLKPHEDFTKKRKCLSYKASMVDYGEERGKSDYVCGELWNVDEKVRILSADYQAGKGSEGAHLWNLVNEWDLYGNSRRLEWRKVETFGQMEQTQLEFSVESENVYCDSGYENRLVFRECGMRHWFATRGSDDDEIPQIVTHIRDGNRWRKLDKPIRHMMPYGFPEPQSGVVGERHPERLKGVHRGRLPFGWARCIVLANPTLYGYITALLGGKSGRYFGIASDFPDTYRDNMPSFIQVITKDKRTNLDRVTWKKIKDEDHAWDCECINLVGAMRANFFPLANRINTPNENIPRLLLEESSSAISA